MSNKLPGICFSVCTSLATILFGLSICINTCLDYYLVAEFIMNDLVFLILCLDRLSCIYFLISAFLLLQLR